jgi:hypothetical protein
MVEGAKTKQGCAKTAVIAQHICHVMRKFTPRPFCSSVCVIQCQGVKECSCVCRWPVIKPVACLAHMMCHKDTEFGPLWRSLCIIWHQKAKDDRVVCIWPVIKLMAYAMEMLPCNEIWTSLFFDTAYASFSAGGLKNVHLVFIWQVIQPGAWILISFSNVSCWKVSYVEAP